MMTSNKPTGFTLINHAGGTTALSHIGGFWRAYTGGESWPIACPYAASGEDNCAISIRVSGANTATPIHLVGADYEGAAAASHDIPSITTTEDNTRAFAFAAFNGCDGVSFTVSGTGWSKVAEVQVDTTGNTSSIVVATKGMASQGATGACTIQGAV